MKGPDHKTQQATMCRTCLLLALAAAMHACFILENPATSMIVHHPRILQLAAMLKKIGQRVPCFGMLLEPRNWNTHVIRARVLV